MGVTAKFSSYLGRAYLAQARAFEAQGKKDDAHAAAVSALDQLQNAVGPDHPDTRAARQFAALDSPHK